MAKAQHPTTATGADYIKFLICARRKRQDTQERYFYEWGNIHVALMLTTPEVMRVFARYAQHFSMSGMTDDQVVYPLSPMGWDNMADHWIRTNDDFVVALTDPGYRTRMQPHKFGDDAFELALCRGHLSYQREGFRTGGGVKLIHWLKKRDDVSQADFEHHFLGEYGAKLLNSAAGPASIRKHVLNTPMSLERAQFKGTLFEHGFVGKYAGVEEIWFNSVEDLVKLRRDPSVLASISTAAAPIIDPAGSFSMVTTERVVFDFATPGEISPPAAIRNPDSLEARAVAQGWKDWNVPKPPSDLAEIEDQESLKQRLG
jgi:EthD domain